MLKQLINLSTHSQCRLCRWEMQQGAELDDGEKAMVEELQKAYFCCSCSGPQDPPETDETLTEQTETEASDKPAAL